MGGDLGIADGGGHPGGNGERDEQCGGADDDIPADAQQSEQFAGLDPAEAQPEAAPNQDQKEPGARSTGR